MHANGALSQLHFVADEVNPIIFGFLGFLLFFQLQLIHKPLTMLALPRAILLKERFHMMAKTMMI